MKTPILFLVFNRPETTKVVFERIREIKPSKLYIAADGARENNESDKIKTKQVKEIVSKVDWDCEVKELFRSKNLGCGRAISSAIDWFFEQEEMGIILEDDCVPELSFFDYCTQLLEYYKLDDEVMHISGSNFQFGRKRGEGSYYFSSFANVWGWATWKSAWEKYDFDSNYIQDFIKNDKLKNYKKSKLERLFWYRKLRKMHNHEVDTWDYQWMFSIWNSLGYSITPNINLIENIGFGEGATHTQTVDSIFSKVAVGSIDDITHPKKKEIDIAADRFTFKHNFRPSLITVLKKIIKR